MEYVLLFVVSLLTREMEYSTYHVDTLEKCEEMKTDLLLKVQEEIIFIECVKAGEMH